MNKLWSAFAVTGLLLGGSVGQAGAVPICSGVCNNFVGTGNGVYSDLVPSANNGIQFLDQYLFDLAGPPPPVYSSFTDTIDALVAINHLGLSIIRVSDNAVIGSVSGTAVGTTGESLALSLTNALFPGVAYYIQVTGDVTPGIQYTGLQNVTPGTLQASTPIPAALPLFATGLGFLGFWSRRRKSKGGSGLISPSAC